MKGIALSSHSNKSSQASIQTKRSFGTRAKLSMTLVALITVFMSQNGCEAKSEQIMNKRALNAQQNSRRA